MSDKKKKVCIVGTAGSKNLTPFQDNSYEFWGVNNAFVSPSPDSHYDRWFEIHNIVFDESKGIWLRRGSPEFRGTPVKIYLEGLRNLNIPVYMRKLYPEMVPKGILYPIDEVVQHFGGLNYLTNTITLELALALYEGFEEIAIYGVDMGLGTEYGSQRPSCELLIGIALGRGVKVVIPDESDLLKTKFIYGIDEPQQDQFTKRLSHLKTELIKKHKDSMTLKEKGEKEMYQYGGSLKMLDEIYQLWANANDKF